MNFLKLPEQIQINEILFRAICIPGIMWQKGRVSSAAFKDSKGVSVDRDGERNEADIIGFLLDMLPSKNAVFKIGYSDILALHIPDVNCTSSPTPNNPFHAEIKRDGDTVIIPSKSARKLAKSSVLVFSPDEKAD